MSQPATSSEADAKSKSSSLSNCLHSAFEITLQKFTSCIQFSSFKKGYKAIYKVDPEGLKLYFEQLKEQFCKNVHEDLKVCSTNHGIDNLLQSLEKINENKYAVSWRPSGNPEDDVKDHLYAYKVRYRDKLQNYLSILQVDNEELTTEATVNHAEIFHLKEKNKEFYEKFSSITDLYTGSKFQKFQAKATECFEELKLYRERVKAEQENTESPQSAKKPRFQ